MTTPSSEDKTVAMDPEEVAIDEFVADYEFYAEDESGTEATHSPTEFERVMIKDAIMGLLADDGYLDARSRLIADTAANAVLERRTALTASGSRGGDERAGIDPLQDPKRPSMFIGGAGDESPAEQVLRKLACWLGVGGYNAPTVDADVFQDKIVWGIEQLLQSRAAAPAEQSAAMPEGREIEVRRNADGTLDEVVGHGHFHLEQMSDTHWWLLVEADRRYMVNFHARGRIKANCEDDGPGEYPAVQTKGKDDSPSGEADPLDTPLPCRVELGGVSFGKGVALRTLVNAARRWRDEAYGPQPTPEEAACALAVLQGTATPQTAAPAAQPEPVACHVADIGFRFDGERQEHVPHLLIEFEPVPVNSPTDAKGWRDRNALAAMLKVAAAPTPAAQSDEALIAAAKAVVERWDTPAWKDAGPTADYINRLRAALAEKGAA